MFPWDHLAIGYVAVSLLFRLRGQVLDTSSALLVALGTQFPDLVDKPLAWSFDVLPSGTSLAHSVFFAVPFSVLLYAITRSRNRERQGLAFVVGYLLHLPADVLYTPLTTGQPVSFGPVLWPLVVKVGGESKWSLFDNTIYYITKYYGQLDSSRVLWFLVLEICLLLGALALWTADGKPGFGSIATVFRRLRA